jgi:HEAT repeat protein
MTAIAKLGNGSVVPLLQTQLQSPVQKQRWWAIRALRITSSPEAVDAIITALRDKDPDIRTHATTSLTELTGHSISKSGVAQPTPTQLENLWRAWWHTHRSSTTIAEYPGELCRMP